MRAETLDKLAILVAQVLRRNLLPKHWKQARLCPDDAVDYVTYHIMQLTDHDLLYQPNMIVAPSTRATVDTYHHAVVFNGTVCMCIDHTMQSSHATKSVIPYRKSCGWLTSTSPCEPLLVGTKLTTRPILMTIPVTTAEEAEQEENVDIGEPAPRPRRRRRV